MPMPMSDSTRFDTEPYPYNAAFGGGVRHGAAGGGSCRVEPLARISNRSPLARLAPAVLSGFRAGHSL